ETLGIVGETGCGKTMTGLSIFNLIPPPGRIEGGRVLFTGRDGKTVDLLSQKESVLTHVRGKDISMIFQEPSSALNPVFTVGNQISEVFLHHRREELINSAINELEKDVQSAGATSLKGRIYKIERNIYSKMLKNPNSLSLRVLSKTPIIKRYKGRMNKECRKQVVNLLKELELPDPERVIDMYPHELSGGMQQRIVIAMALACNPLLLTADEPTTSLDVTIQARILDLIRRLKKRFGASVIFITHDLGVIAEMCDRVAVMYAGNMCEIADVVEIFKRPFHPYTKALMESIPRVGEEYKSIRGTVPNLIDPPPGCRFHPRCSNAMEICAKVKPEMIEVKKDHFVSCHLFDGCKK
ncbi:MAG: ABC transporter ATP-binding protein, partial [Thermoproteota archaeon]|nr:ABC transporter ATP-binding protein [Thermoproteota archaeon]